MLSKIQEMQGNNADQQQAELRALFYLRNQADVSFISFFDSFGDAYSDNLQLNLF